MGKYTKWVLIWGKLGGRHRLEHNAKKGAAIQRRRAAGTKLGKAHGAKVKLPRAIPARDCPRSPSHGLEELLSLRGSRWLNRHGRPMFPQATYSPKSN